MRFDLSSFEVGYQSTGARRFFPGFWTGLAGCALCGVVLSRVFEVASEAVADGAGGMWFMAIALLLGLGLGLLGVWWVMVFAANKKLEGLGKRRLSFDARLFVGAMSQVRWQAVMRVVAVVSVMVGVVVWFGMYAAWRGGPDAAVKRAGFVPPAVGEPVLVEVRGVWEQGLQTSGPSRGALWAFDFARPSSYGVLKVKAIRVKGALGGQLQDRDAQVSARNDMIDAEATWHEVGGKLLVRFDGLMPRQLAFDSSKHVGLDQAGQRVQAAGWLSSFSKPANPGLFDAGEYWASQGVVGTLNIADDARTLIRWDEPIDPNWGVGFKRQLDGMHLLTQQKTRESLLAGIHDADAQAMLAALLLGQKNPGAMMDTRGVFRQAGLAHVMSISGAHLTVLMIAVGWLIGVFCRRPNWAWVMLLIWMGLFVWVVPWRVPVLRAALMMMAVLGVQPVGRQLPFLERLSLALVVLVLVDPHDIWTAGFQLSFAVVAGIGILSPVLTAWLQALSRKGLARVGPVHLLRDWPCLNAQDNRGAFGIKGRLRWFVSLAGQVLLFLRALPRGLKGELFRALPRALHRGLRRGGWIGLSQIALPLSVSVVAFLIAMPLGMFHFQEVHTWTVWAALLALIPFALVMILGLAKMVAGLLWPAVGAWLGEPMQWITSIALEGVVFLGHLPGAEWHTPQVSGGWVLGAMLLLMIGFAPWGGASKRVLRVDGDFVIKDGAAIGTGVGIKSRALQWVYKKSRFIAGFIWLIWMAWGLGFIDESQSQFGDVSDRPEEGGVVVTALSVGDGSAWLIRTHDHVYMFDCGSRRDLGVGRQCVDWLAAMGVDQLDGVFISHGDLDHFGGVLDLAQRIEIEQVWSSPQTFEKLVPNTTRDACFSGLKDLNLKPQTIEAGWKLEVDGVVLEVIGPLPNWQADKDNDHSLVMRISAAGRRFLLTGDAEAQALKALLDAGVDLKADAAETPHHGAVIKATEDWIHAIGATDWIQSCGYKRLENDQWPQLLQTYAIDRQVVVDEIKRQKQRPSGSVSLPQPQTQSQLQSSIPARWSTAQHGAIRWAVDPQGKIHITTYKK